MSFIAKAFGGGGGGSADNTAQVAALQTQVTDLKAAQTVQKNTINTETKNVAAVEAAQRRVRLGAARGLLAFTEKSSGLSTTLGGN